MCGINIIKVDVWSVGVIYYQMLFGIRPFGEGMSQQRMYKAGTILDAKMVDFPSKPSVSQEAKVYIYIYVLYENVIYMYVYVLFFVFYKILSFI